MINFYPSNKKSNLFIDKYLFILIILVSFIGLVVLFSASQGNINMIIKQSLFVFFGLLLMFLIAQIEPDYLNAYSIFFLAASTILLLMTYFFGVEINGAKRWLSFGFFSLQPSELIKISLPIFLATFLYTKNLPINIKNTSISILITIIYFLIIALQPDLGTSMVVLLSGLYVIFLAGLSWKFILFAFSIFIFSLPFLWQNFLEPFQRQRILTLIDPSQDPYGTGWNISQSKIAIGSGGVFGKGYQNGSQSHLEFLPETETDFIFAVIAEEFGLLGVVILLFLFSFILARCFFLAINARDRFCRLTIGGLTLVFASTFFINLLMVVGLIPVVGMPLPFISKGGSSLLSFYIAFGVIMSMASHKKLMQR